MRTLLFLFLVISSFFIACVSSDAGAPTVDTESENFDRYLRFNFGDSIGGGTHFYLLVTKKGSREQLAEKLRKVKNLLTALPANAHTSYISADVPVTDSLLPCGKNKTDWDGAIDRLAFVHDAVTLVRTKNGRVTGRETVLDQPGELLRQFFKAE